MGALMQIQLQNQAETLNTASSMYQWRLNRHASEKREEAVNRELLRRQHAH
jgi:hypothetical protein